MQFRGWRPGVLNITPSANDDRYEYEVQWYYKHPVVKAIIPWGHGSRVRPWYGNRTKVQYVIRPCTDQMIRNTTYLIGDWEGQATLWASQPD